MLSTLLVLTGLRNIAAIFDVSGNDLILESKQFLSFFYLHDCFAAVKPDVPSRNEPPAGLEYVGSTSLVQEFVLPFTGGTFGTVKGADPEIPIYPLASSSQGGIMFFIKF